MRAYLEACEKYYGVRSEDYARTARSSARCMPALVGTNRPTPCSSVSIELNAAMENAGTNAELATAYRRHAQFCMNLSRNAEAVKDLEAALAIITAIHGDGHHIVATYEMLLADATFANGDPATTLLRATHALELLQDRVQALKSS